MGVGRRRRRRRRRRRSRRRRRDKLIILTSTNLAPEMALFIVQILELEMQRVNLLPFLGGGLLGAADFGDGFAVEAAQEGETAAERLLFGEESRVFVGGRAVLFDEVEERVALLPRVVRGGEDGNQSWMGDDIGGGHVMLRSNSSHGGRCCCRRCCDRYFYEWRYKVVLVLGGRQVRDKLLGVDLYSPHCHHHQEPSTSPPPPSRTIHLTAAIKNHPPHPPPHCHLTTTIKNHAPHRILHFTGQLREKYSVEHIHPSNKVNSSACYQHTTVHDALVEACLQCGGHSNIRPDV
jgi:hypothetical protein